MPLPPRVGDLTGFDLLRSVARLGSIGRAATAHGISQPAASVRIRQLEALVGVPLVQRSARGSTLTTAGALVAGWARTALDAAAELEVGIAALGAGPAGPEVGTPAAALDGGHPGAGPEVGTPAAAPDGGTPAAAPAGGAGPLDAPLRVGASSTVAEHLVPRWLAALRVRAPDTAVALLAGNSTEVADAVLAGRADLGFVDGPDGPDGLAGATVARDELVVVVAPDHPWARGRRSIGPGELARTRLVGREPGSGTRQALERALRAHAPGGPAPLVRELPSAAAVTAAVLAGVAPAVISSYSAAGELAAGTLARVPVTEVDLRRDLRVVWRAGERLGGPAAELAAIAARRPGRTPE